MEAEEVKVRMSEKRRDSAASEGRRVWRYWKKGLAEMRSAFQLSRVSYLR